MISPYTIEFQSYLQSTSVKPLFLCGDALSVLSDIPNNAVDFCMTSPPYWRQRVYESGGLGLESTPEAYIDSLLLICAEIKRVLKNTGSFWLNIGDSYESKRLLGIPWRVALQLGDTQGWILRNDVIWNKLKGPDNSKDKLRNTHEHLFHFVKQKGSFYYNVDAIRTKPRDAYLRNGAIVSATGVTGVRYKRQIELSTALDGSEKKLAFEALEHMLHKLTCGEISDFRMVIRRQQRTTHSNSEAVSGRAKELAQKGFYFLLYHAGGSKPSDVWDILPEDRHRDSDHAAVYPEDLCRIPLLASCPPNGLALDPFCGTGTTNLVAFQLERKSVGLDISAQYLADAKRRCDFLL